MMDSSPGSRAAADPGSAEEAFLDYFARRDEGEGVDLEQYCARYPQWAEELRALDRDWRDLAVGLDRAAGPSVDPSAVQGEAAAEARARARVDGTLARLKRSVDGEGAARYRVVDEIDRGGMGAVLRVFDEDLRRELAMKVIIQDEAGGPLATPARRIARFLEEARIAGQLDHPGIVPVHELGVDEQGAAYFTMKLVRGKTLRDAIVRAHEPHDGDWNLTRVVGALQKVCEAMAYAHERGVLHRDLKPANVMVGAYGEVYVMDWGLARIVDQEGTTSRASDGRPATDRGGSRAGGSSPALVTSAGDVVGTPAYMSPEQALGRIDELGSASDVYSAGAILYHAIAGHPPHVDQGSLRANRTILGSVREGPPRALAAAAPDAPAELVAICERAMARDPGDRYPSMRALADDPRAFLEGRVVRAYESGAWAGLRKWILRNRFLAASLAAVVLLPLAGTAAVAVVEARGRAAAEAQRRIAESERESVLRLSARRHLDELEQEAFAASMWPPSPDKRERYRDWLDRARELVAGLDEGPSGYRGHRAQLERLQASGTELPPEEREAARAAHPARAELEEARRKLAAWRRGAAIRAGEIALEVPPVPESVLELGTGHQHWYVRSRVTPTRDRHGEEDLALAMAYHIVDTAADARELASALDNLALALVASGQDEEARAVMSEAHEVAPPEVREQFVSYRAQLEAEIEASTGERGVARIAALEGEIARLERELEAVDRLTFADAESAWWHDQLSSLVADLERFADPRAGAIDGIVPGRGWGVGRRLEFARRVEELSVSAPEAAAAWDSAIASVRDAEQCPAYDGLEIEPQTGLVPLGRDAHSGLWEFLHLMSSVTEDGTLDRGSGIVLVLLPGGRFLMGTQVVDPGAPNYDPYGTYDGDLVHAVELDPFFISKYEMTQEQWRRARGENPSGYAEGDEITGRPLTGRHPVESMTWEACREVCAQLGLALPTEAQWEYAARGGTTAAWSTGADERSLAGHANLADQTARRFGMFPAESVEWLEDGHVIHAEVDALAPNPFGLHHVHGNVAEWCADRYTTYYRTPEPGTGLRRGRGATGRHRVLRGGAFSGLAGHAGSGSRGAHPESLPNRYAGLRPARALDRSPNRGTNSAGPSGIDRDAHDSR